jgi:hypothetical protein
MATTITPTTLTVSITETLDINGTDQGGTNQVTIANVKEFDKRIVRVPFGSEVNLLTYGTAVGSGQVVRSNIAYLRITNKDDTNFIRIRAIETSGATADIKLEAGKSFMLHNGKLSGDDSGGAFSAYADIDNIAAQADTADVDIEYLIALT